MIGANVCCVYDATTQAHSKYQLCEKSCRKQILECVSFFYIVTSENLLTVQYRIDVKMVYTVIIVLFCCSLFNFTSFFELRYLRATINVGNARLISKYVSVTLDHTWRCDGWHDDRYDIIPILFLWIRVRFSAADSSSQFNLLSNHSWPFVYTQCSLSLKLII